MARHNVEVTLTVLDDLPVLVRSCREQLGLSLRSAELVSGVPFNVIKRCEDRAGDVTVETAVRLLRWVSTIAPVRRPSK